MTVVVPAWNHVPVNVGNNVTKTCQVNFVWLVHDTECRFSGKDHTHQSHLLVAGEVGHFANVLAQDDAAKTGIIPILDAYHAAEIVFPQQFPPGHLAQFAADSRLRQVGAELCQGRCILSTISSHIFMLSR